MGWRQADWLIFLAVCSALKTLQTAGWYGCTRLVLNVLASPISWQRLRLHPAISTLLIVFRLAFQSFFQ